MTESLFRKEVLAVRQTRWLGGISLAQPFSLWLFAGLAVFAAAAVIAFAVIGDYTRRTRVTGQLIPTAGVANVLSPGTGILSQVRVEEGQVVRAGEVLAVLAKPRATLLSGDTGSAMQRELAQRRQGISDGYASQRRQLATQGVGLAAQADSVRGELAQIERELVTRRQQQALAEQSLERYRSLREKRYVTDLQLQQQQTVALNELAAVQALQRQSIAARRVLAQLDQAARELPSQLASLAAAERRDTASLAQESVEADASAEAVITAPVSGTVSTRLGGVGQSVQAGQPVLSLVPEASHLEAHLLVPSRAVGFAEPGDVVLLRYQAYPYQKFGHYTGHVTRISRSALSQGVLGSLIGNTQAGEPRYRIVVAIDRQVVRAFGKDEALKPGLLLEADILGERRKLWEWAIEPLYTLTGRIGGATP